MIHCSVFVGFWGLLNEFSHRKTFQLLSLATKQKINFFFTKQNEFFLIFYVWQLKRIRDDWTMKRAFLSFCTRIVELRSFARDGAWLKKHTSNSWIPEHITGFSFFNLFSYRKYFLAHNCLLAHYAFSCIKYTLTPVH